MGQVVKEEIGYSPVGIIISTDNTIMPLYLRQSNVVSRMSEVVWNDDPYGIQRFSFPKESKLKTFSIYERVQKADGSKGYDYSKIYKYLYSVLGDRANIIPKAVLLREDGILVLEELEPMRGVLRLTASKTETRVVIESELDEVEDTEDDYAVLADVLDLL